VVLLHGAIIAGSYMVPVGDALSRQHAVYGPDLPGMGRSRRLEAPASIAALADAVAAWVAEEGLPPVALVGNSLGCQVAVEVAVRHRDRVAALILIGPTVDPLGKSPIRLFARSIGVALSEPPQLHVTWLRDLGRAGPVTALRVLSASLRHAIEEALPEVAVPTLVIRGRRDRLVSQEFVEAAARILPQGSLAAVEGAGHAAHYSRPERVAALITAFLAGVNEPPGSPAAQLPPRR
jgi:pimeloyl-ACP methyl ester carboxylesterase